MRKLKIKVFFLASLLVLNLFFLGCDAKEKIEQIDKVVKKTAGNHRKAAENYRRL